MMVRMASKITATQVRQTLIYDRESGVFTWRLSRPGVKKGDVAGTEHGRGYITVCVENRPFLAHRLAWFYVTGEWPPHQIDHKNTNKKDNRFSNLRAVTNQVNNQNLTRPRPNNKSGFLGVVSKPYGRFQARIKVDGVAVSLGTFGTAQEAHDCYVVGKRRLHEGCML